MNNQRPKEHEYASHVSYGRALEDYCDALEGKTAHREGYWCEDLTCSKCYSADFRFKHTPPERRLQEYAQEAAVRTLTHLRYTYHGSTHWKPPLGDRPEA
jgi:hypothetical protein